MSYYEIPSDQLSTMEAFAETNNDPIVMVNLLKIRDRAEYPPDSSAKPCSGREAFARYQEGSSRVRKESGARLVWRANVAQMPIAPIDEKWDLVALVQYPSASAYLKMRATSEYQAARLHRQAALADSRLIMCIEA